VPTSPGGPAAIAYVLVSAVLRGVSAALAGVVLVGGLALLVWAITPATGSNAGGLLRSSMVVLSAGHFLPVTVAGAALTIHPLTVTVISVLVVASSASRGRAVRGRSMEAVHGLVLAVAYAATIDLVARALIPADEVQLTVAPLVLAGVGVILGLATHRTAWHRWWRRTAPPFLRYGLRAGSAAVCLMIAAGALAVAVGLAASFQDALAVARLTAPGAGDGFALALLSLAFLPNAAIAGVGYLSGAGFTFGAASYSPFGSSAVQLPAIPLLTAAPDAHPASRVGLLFLAVPLLVGVLIAVWVDRRLDLRWQRMAAAATASTIAGIGVAGLALAAAGGVSGGPWAATGAPPLLAGSAVGGVVAVVSLAWTGVAGLGRVRWRAERSIDDAKEVDAGADAVPVAGASGPGVGAALGEGDDAAPSADGSDGAAGETGRKDIEAESQTGIDSGIDLDVDSDLSSEIESEAESDTGSEGGSESDVGTVAEVDVLAADGSEEPAQTPRPTDGEATGDSTGDPGVDEAADGGSALNADADSVAEAEPGSDSDDPYSEREDTLAAEAPIATDPAPEPHAAFPQLDPSPADDATAVATEAAEDDQQAG
jgi:hypothetical protein